MLAHATSRASSAARAKERAHATVGAVTNTIQYRLADFTAPSVPTPRPQASHPRSYTDDFGKQLVFVRSPPSFPFAKPRDLPTLGRARVRDND
jgi:hypothetical protein